MEWNNSSCLKLIEYYREYRCLWDPTCEDYKSNTKKDDAWIDISNLLECRVDEIRRKMDSLLASHRRERLKGMHSKNAGTIYKSRWFAYHAMQFLLDKYEKSRSRNAEEVVIVEPVMETLETNDSPKFMNDNLPQTFSSEPYLTQMSSASSSQIMEFKLPRVNELKKKYVEDPLRETDFTKPAKDECTLFGEYVAMKLGKYSPYTKSTAQHLISNILFEADMGKYNEPQFSPAPSIKEWDSP